jgi:hypothetical protein
MVGFFKPNDSFFSIWKRQTMLGFGGISTKLGSSPALI